MVVLYKNLPNLMPVAGIRIATASAGIKKPGRNDVTLFELEETSAVAVTFTRNLFCAAPVVLAKEHLQKTAPKYLLINTGNANAGTGVAGYENAKSCCQCVADIAGCSIEAVLPFSTGVIGAPLPEDRICSVIPDLVHNLQPDSWDSAASAILTTDTVPKGVSKKLSLSTGDVTITGIAKGSGMIRPDMATMLAFIATDARLGIDALNSVLHAAVNRSFNRITVDGDTSTNDACVLISTGASGVSADMADADMKLFSDEITKLMIELAKQIVKDGEGATKFVTINITEGRDDDECCSVAYTIAHSPLVKTALFASDPNWGRILAAVGRAGLVDLDLGNVNISIGDVLIVSSGEPNPDYTEESGRRVMSEEEIDINVRLGRGSAKSTIWTCDFSYDYVKINADYRT